MPRIDTFTATLTNPPQRTAEELSISSAQQPGAALAGLGHELQRSGAILADIADQRSREQELRWAADANQRFTEDSIRWQQANGNREDAGEQFKAWSDGRIGELLKEAPNSRAETAFKIHVQPQANRDWEFNLKRGEATRLTNYKVGETAVSEASNEAYTFRSDQQNPDAEPLRAQDLKAQISRNNAAYGVSAPAHAQSMNEDAVVNAVLGAIEVNPKFAKQLLNDFPLVDPKSRDVLLSKIKSAEVQKNQGALFDLTQTWQNAYKVSQANGTFAPTVPSERLFTALGGEHGREVHAQMMEHADVQNTAVSTIDELKNMNASAAKAKLASKFTGLGAQEGSKADGLRAAHDWLSKSWKLQDDDAVAWQISNQEPVANLYKKSSDAFTEASKMPDGPDKAEAQRKASQLQDRAFTVSKFLQGPAPMDATDSEKALFLNHVDTHILPVSLAEHYAQQIQDATPEQRIQIARSLKAQYGEHSADFFADLATLPGPSKGLSPALIQGLNIQNERHAAAYMQAQTGQKAENRLDPKAFKDYATTLDSNGDWKKYMQGWLGEYNQRDKFMGASRDGILNYATSLSLSGQAKDPTDAVAMALKHVVTDQVGLPTVNGRIVPMARETKVLGPLAGRRNHTDEELDDIGRGLTILLRQVDPNELDRHAFVTAPPGEQGTDFVMRRIWTNGYYVTDHDGQSATLYIPGDDGPIQVRDKNNRPLRVVFDEVPNFTTEYTPMSRDSLLPTYEKPISRKRQPVEFEKGFGRQDKSVVIPGEARSKGDSETDLPMLLPSTRIDTTSWNWPTTSPLFRR